MPDGNCSRVFRRNLKMWINTRVSRIWIGLSGFTGFYVSNHCKGISGIRICKGVTADNFIFTFHKITTHCFSAY